MEKIRSVSRILQKIFLLIFMALPICSIIFWFFLKAPNDIALTHHYLPLSFFTAWSYPDYQFNLRLIGFVTNLLPLSLEMVCLYSLMQLFKLYESGKIFTLENVKYIRYIALTLIVGEIFRPFNQILTSYLFSLYNPPGHRLISVTFTNTDISNLLMGVVILLASWIMAEACKLHEEHTFTI